ncbi:MAG: sodium:alanine symporter family protein [Hydrogenoanaerobacterium sp.]
MELIMQINSAINSVVWGPVMIALLMGTGIYFTVRTGFLQFRKFGYILKNTIATIFSDKKSAADGSVTPFQALTTALAGTIGTGNIVGVATAITTGGPGAVFWMWISALVGMMTKYSEIVLAVHYREKNSKGEWKGGPMYYIEKGLKQKWLAVVFAALASLAAFGIGNMTQGNSIASSMKGTFGIPPIVTGLVVAALIAFTVVGGVKRIGAITEKMVPFMSLFYIICSLLVLTINWQNIIPSFALVFRSAFTPTAAIGGFLGAGVMKAIQSGMARGIFSNEAGLGSAPIAHAAADTKHPVQQGMWGVFEVFADTIMVCTCTALVILTSGLWDSGLKGSDLTMAAFSQSLSGLGGIVITIALFFFAFSTMLGWSYYGEKSFEYLFGEKYILLYRVAFIVVAVVGSVAQLDVVWGIADTLNGLMAIPNLIGLLGLSGVVIKLTKEYFKNAGKPHAKIER